jgi:hypothetical protein
MAQSNLYIWMGFDLTRFNNLGWKFVFCRADGKFHASNPKEKTISENSPRALLASLNAKYKVKK